MNGSTDETNVQATLIQIDNYGPWTVTPEPRPEMDLQTLQSQLFATIAQFVGSRGGYVFSTRYDNVVAVTNSLDEETLLRLQQTVRDRFPVTISIGVATHSSPAVALERATNEVQAAGSAQDHDRQEVLSGTTIAEGERTATDLSVAHFDVKDVTNKYTNQLGEFDTFTRIQRTYTELMEHMYRTHDALSFFVGGDNFISVCPALDRTDYEQAVAHVEETASVELRVGTGRGREACEAGLAAKHALEEAREADSIVRMSRSAGVVGERS